jgi:condensin complex subunit 1
MHPRNNGLVLDLITLLVTYVSQKTNSQTESMAVKNLKEILSQTCKKIPKLFYLNLSTFMELYDNENYHLRNALTDIISFVIEHLTKDNEKDDEENHMNARNKLLDTLLSKR